MTTDNEDRDTKLSFDPSYKRAELYVSRPVLADGRRLKAIRVQWEMSVRELSEASGISTSTIYRLEKGRLRQSWAEMHTLRKIAGALGVDPAELVKGEEATRSWD